MGKKIKDLRKEIDKVVISNQDIINLLKIERMTIEELSIRLDLPPRKIMQKISELQADNYMIKEYADGCYSMSDTPESKKHYLNPEMWQGDELKFGAVSDNHLCNKNSREDVLNMLYDLFESEGVKNVFHTGNMIDGQARFNMNELHTFGLDNQAIYAARNYPYKKGITTHFITADDHEGWWQQSAGVEVGEYLLSKRKEEGRYDFNYLGYAEADIDLNGGEFKNKLMCRLLHPGGGNAYATSYVPQKIVESYSPGEKPQVLLVGHHHDQLFMNIRGVWVLMTATTCDQTLFLRKNKIDVAVGGAIVTIRRNSEGLCNRIMADLISVFDKGFYIGKDKYWKK